MKSLYESILGDIEDNIADGDNMIKTVNETFDKIKKLFCTKSKWDKHSGRYEIKYYIGVGSVFNHSDIKGDDLKLLLQQCGFNANHLYISLTPPPNYVDKENGSNYWKMIVSMTLSESFEPIPTSKLKDYEIMKEVIVYIPNNGSTNNLSNALKYMKLKFKDIDNFTKFLNDIKSHENKILN